MKILALLSIGTIAARPATVCDNCPIGETCYYPGPTESQFIECCDGKEIPLECPSEYVWDNIKNSCVVPFMPIPECVCPDNVNTCFYEGPTDAEYFECHNGHEIPFECQSEYVWDSNTNSCIIIVPTPECVCPGGVESCYYAGPTEKDFIECCNGKEVPLECPSEYVWDNARKSCIEPFEPFIPDCVCPDDAHICYYAGLTDERYIECHDGKEIPKECRSEYVWDRETNSCVVPFIPDCVCLGDVNTCYYSGPNEKIFIECNHGKEYPLECPPEYVWSNILNSCIPFADTIIPECVCPGCVNTCYYAGLTDNRYIECHNGKEIPLECPSEYVWDSIKNSCVVPTIVPECICPGEATSCYSSGIKENEFIECCNGHVIPLECPSEFVWDSKKNSCIIIVPIPECVCPGNVNTCFYEGPTDAEYFECHNGHEIPFECQSEYVWDSNTNSCIIIVPIPECVCPGGVESCYYAGPTEKDFIECCNGKEVPLECPSEYVWDNARKSCIEPFEPFIPDCVCLNDAHICYYEGPTNTEYFECHDGKEIPLECTSGYVWDSKTNSCVYFDIIDPKCHCPGNVDKCYYEGPTNTEFFECCNGKETPLECPSGYIWDSHIDSCIPIIAA